MDIAKSSCWRPTDAEIKHGKALVSEIQSNWARTRLKLLSALAENPGWSLQQLAQHIDTRVSIIGGFFERWRTLGTASIAQYGRPRELNGADLEELQTAISTGRVRSLVQAGSWIEERKPGLRLTLSCLRAYCKKLEIKLPTKSKLPPKLKVPIIRVYRWSAGQISELGGYKGHHQDRVKAILRVGTESLSINDIAEKCEVPATTLRLDLKCFSDGGLQKVVTSWKKENVLLREGIWPPFVTWCNEYYKSTNNCLPSGEETRAYLKNQHQLLMPLRSVYTHLRQWMTESGILCRGRTRVVDKLIPSEGITVRSL